MLSTEEIFERLKETPAGDDLYVCPLCGEEYYVTAHDNEDSTLYCDKCDCKDPLQIFHHGDMIHYENGNPDPEWEYLDLPHIRSIIRQEETNEYNIGRSVNLFVCPDCGGFRWSIKHDGVMFCPVCKNEHVIADTFVL